MKDGIDLVVVNYRTPEDLQHFLMSVEKHPPTVPWSLVVVNVDPLERDVDVAQRYVTRSPDKITSLNLSENVGYARAVNKASLVGEHPVFVAFNADTRITENVIDLCYDALQTHDEWGILGPKQIDDYGKITYAGIFGKDTSRFHTPNYKKYDEVREDATDVSGAAFFIKRSVWDELTACDIYAKHTGCAEGAFLPTPHYYEETFCSYHAIAHGYKVVYFGEACMIHRWHQASSLGGRVDRNMPISRQLFRDACDAHQIEHD